MIIISIGIGVLILNVCLFHKEIQQYGTQLSKLKDLGYLMQVGNIDNVWKKHLEQNEQ